MEIREVKTIEEARMCNNLLTELIRDESKYNKNLADNFVVNNYFENIYLNKNNLLLISVIDNEIVGYAFAKKISSDEIIKSVLIDGIYVIESARNKGIATKLIERIQKWCKEKEIDEIKIKVVIANKSAYNLYKKLGFDDYSIELTKSL